MLPMKITWSKFKVKLLQFKFKVLDEDIKDLIIFEEDILMI